MQLRPSASWGKKLHVCAALFLANIQEKGSTDALPEAERRSNDISRSRFPPPRCATAPHWCSQHLLSRVGTLTLSLIEKLLRVVLLNKSVVDHS